METARADARTAGGWGELSRTITPRLFVAGRADAQRFHDPRPVHGDFVRERYTRLEAVLGVRFTPELTLRGGYMGRKGYVVSHWDDQVVVSIVLHRKVL